MYFEDLASCQEYVKKRLSALTPIFAKASVGDFSQKIEIPEDEDEFTELYVGIHVMQEVIQEQLKNLQSLNNSFEERVGELDREVFERKKADAALKISQSALEKQTKELEVANMLIEEEKARDEALLACIGDGVVALDKQGIIHF